MIVRLQTMISFLKEFYEQVRRRIFGPSREELRQRDREYWERHFREREERQEQCRKRNEDRLAAARAEEDRLWNEWRLECHERAIEFGRWMDENDPEFALHRTGEPFYWCVPFVPMRIMRAVLIPCTEEATYPIDRPEDSSYCRIPSLEELTSAWQSGKVIE